MSSNTSVVLHGRTDWKFINGVQVLNPFMLWLRCNVYRFASEPTLWRLNVFPNECVRMCLGALRYTCVAQMEAETIIAPLYLQRDALLLSYGIKAAQKVPRGTTATKTIWQHHHLHTVVYRPIGSWLNTLCQLTDIQLDDADHLVMPILPSWKRPTVAIINSWLERKKAVAGAELQQRFRSPIASLPPFSHLYVNGIKTDKRMGASVWSCECVLRFRLPIHTSVFSAEIFALDRAIDCVLNSSHHSIVIFRTHVCLSGNRVWAHWYKLNSGKHN